MIDNLTEAIRYFSQKARNIFLGETFDNYGKLASWLEELKERREADRWIPVSERLPDEFEDVIVRDIEVTRTYSGYYIGNGCWACDNGTFRDRITHWRPFPEYKESE